MSFSLEKTTNITNRYRRSNRKAISTKEAIATAIGLLKSDTLSPTQKGTMQLLATGGVLTTNQLKQFFPVTNKTLSLYYLAHYIDHIVAPDTLDKYHLPQVFQSHLRLYTLGAVGHAITKIQEQQTVDYSGYASHQIAHDILTNQVAIQLIQHAQQIGRLPTWLGKYEARVHASKDGKTSCTLEPDALIISRAEKQPAQSFAIEFHNEDHSGRASDKVERYERENRNQAWRQSWPLDSFPTVLVVFHAKAVITGYKAAVEKARGRGVKCRYLAREFSTLMSGDQPLEKWYDIETNKIVDDIFSMEKKA